MTDGENCSEDGSETNGETPDKTIDQYLWAFWGDTPQPGGEPCIKLPV